jgi:hypothetical protein
MTDKNNSEKEKSYNKFTESVNAILWQCPLFPPNQKKIKKEIKYCSALSIKNICSF